MVIKNIKRHGSVVYQYFGEIDGQKVIVVFEDGAKPVEGDIKVTLGKIVIKNNQNFCYVKSYGGWING